MKKRMILLIVVLIAVTGLLVGCTTYPIRQEGKQNGSNVNVDGGTRGNNSGGNGNGQRVGSGNGSCDSAGAYSPAVASTTESVSNEANAAVVTEGYGASGAIADENLTLAEMLTYAIQDEYLAHAEYAYIIDTFGNTRPFSNIIKAEEQHIDTLLPLFTEYGIQAPDDIGSEHAVAVSSLAESYQAGEQAEMNNIAMYDEFLKQDLPDDVRTAFESLREASENHLAAFRNHL